MASADRQILEVLRLRVVEARAALDALPSIAPGALGPPDPETGERWSAGHVLGHTAEALTFWTAQARAVAGGTTTAGRGEAGYAQRQEAISSGLGVPESEMLARVGAAIDGLQALLADLNQSDLARSVSLSSRSGSREITLEEFLEAQLVSHLEEHVRQLAELEAGS
jgi:hypothetical protein